MPVATKLNDKGTQHDGYRETVITAGSSTVFIDGLPAARQSDPLSRNQDSRLSTLDEASEDLVKAGNGSEKMNVKLELFRCNGLR
ncbi:hypothetical protein D0525_01720 [Salmonella enterica]|nr:hypothetical protein D0525_01720 [Salmonella enterica]